jgi:peptidyl-prolyl cis-trans isomerase C
MENKTLAVVDGRKVTEKDLSFLLQSIGQNAAQFQGEAGRKQLIDELVMQELLYSDALKQGYDQDAEFKEALDQMQRSLLKQYSLNKLLTAISIPDEELLAYFNSHQELFKKPETAVASHILVSTEEEATSIANEIKEGLDFAEAASKYSSCPSKAEGGNLGEFSRGRMVPEFEVATFALEPGEMSGPVQTQFGYHLIKLTSKNESATPSFEEVKENVRGQLLQIKQGETYTNKKAELEAEYSVSIEA